MGVCVFFFQIKTLSFFRVATIVTLLVVGAVAQAEWQPAMSGWLHVPYFSLSLHVLNNSLHETSSRCMCSPHTERRKSNSLHNSLLRLPRPSPKKIKPTYHGNPSPSHCTNFPPSFSLVALSTTCKYPLTHSSTLMARKKSSPDSGSAACSINELDISVTTSPG